MTRGLLALGLALSLALPVQASDFISVDRRLDDFSFYRLVSCGAAPGGPCQGPPIAWPASSRADLTVRFDGRDPGVPPILGQAALRALQSAIQTINGAGVGVRLRRVDPESPARIVVQLRDIPEGGTIRGTSMPGLDGQTLEIARFHLTWNARREIQRGMILISRDIERRDLPSVLLEELVQSLGLPWDVRGSAYRGRSIFDEDSNAVTRLAGQDLAALRQHHRGAQ